MTKISGPTWITYFIMQNITNKDRRLAHPTSTDERPPSRKFRDLEERMRLKKLLAHVENRISLAEFSNTTTDKIILRRIFGE